MHASNEWVIHYDKERFELIKSLGTHCKEINLSNKKLWVGT